MSGGDAYRRGGFRSFKNRELWVRWTREHRAGIFNGCRFFFSMWRDGMSGFRWKPRDTLGVDRGEQILCFLHAVMFSFCFNIAASMATPHRVARNHSKSDVPRESGVKWFTSEKLCHGKRNLPPTCLQGLIGLNVGCLFVFQPLPLTGRLRMVLASSFLASHFAGMGWFGTQKVVKVFWVA